MASINYIANSTQLNKELQTILGDVVDAVCNTLLSDFQQHLNATIYAAPEGKEYKRFKENGGFYSGWKIKEHQRSAISGYIKSLAFDGGALKAPSYDNHLAHGGTTGGDLRGYMADILNDIQSNDTYSYAGGAKYLSDGMNSEGYWTSYLRDIDKKVESWLDTEFKKHGIVRG